MSGMEHLRKALHHAERAVEGFPDGSREERVADNAVAWTSRAIEIIERDFGTSDKDSTETEQ